MLSKLKEDYVVIGGGGGNPFAPQKDHENCPEIIRKDPNFCSKKKVDLGGGDIRNLCPETCFGTKTTTPVSSTNNPTPVSSTSSGADSEINTKTIFFIIGGVLLLISIFAGGKEIRRRRRYYDDYY